MANRELKEFDARITGLIARFDFDSMLRVIGEQTERLKVDREHPDSGVLRLHYEISAMLNLLNRKLLNIQNLFLTAASEPYTEKNVHIQSQLELKESAAINHLEASLFNQWTKNRKLRERLASNSIENIAPSRYLFKTNNHCPGRGAGTPCF